MSYSITLYRSVKERVRYYTIAIFPTLFGEWLLERKYGSLKNKKPTRTLSVYYSSVDEARVQYEKICKSKRQKGYC
jgi:predicted DNA-binding WGR domain protein